MEIKRCVRCGSLHTTEGDVCRECSIKDNAEVVKLKGIIDEGLDAGITKQDLAIKAGITAKNLNRYLQAEEFNGMYFPEASLNIGGIDADKIGKSIIK
jgi:hypothetical protein